MHSWYSKSKLIPRKLVFTIIFLVAAIVAASIVLHDLEYRSFITSAQLDRVIVGQLVSHMHMAEERVLVGNIVINTYFGIFSTKLAALAAKATLILDESSLALAMMPPRDIIFFFLAAVFLLLAIALLFVRSFTRVFMHKTTVMQVDILTALPTRESFYLQLKNSINQSHHLQQQFYLLCLDIDNFKSVNDVFGHNVGDMLLKEIASKLRRVFADKSYLARLDGDAFAIIIADGNKLQRDALNKLIANITDNINGIYSINNQQISISISMGVVGYPMDADEPFSLIKYAELALYAAKQQGRNRVHFFSVELIAEQMQRAHVENALRFALEKEEFSLVYQPIYSLAGELLSMEVLLRWNHSELGAISPEQFIPVAEATSLIEPITEWVLRNGCHQYSTWIHGLDVALHCKIAFNLSPWQLQSANFISKLRAIISEFAIDPKNVEFELTETAVMHELERASEILTELRSMGFGVTIDDFGTGYASLGYLQQLPVTALKIDKSFVAGVPDNVHDVVIVNSTLKLAADLNLAVIVEGIETAEQLEFLTNYPGCMLQGFYLSKPLSGVAMHQLLQKQLYKRCVS